jgi:hypothetical protein
VPEPVACKRHPANQTRLRCQSCDDPICPQCLVQTPVGQKCPTDAKLPRSSRAMGTPRQVGRAIGAAVGVAVVGGLALGFVVGLTGGFLSIIVSYFGGHGLGDVVRKAAEGNGAARFRTIAMVGAGVMILVMWVSAFGIITPRGLSALSYAAAVYGAYGRFPG